MLRLDDLEDFLDFEEIIPEGGVAQRFSKGLPDGMAFSLPHPDIGYPRGVKFGIEIAKPERALLLTE